MNENGIILDSKIKCQNCNFTLALRSGDGESIMVASDVERLIQVLDKDTILMTLQCKKCGCVVQVIS